MVTETMASEHAIGDTCRARSDEAIATITHGLRVLHSLPIDEVPAHWAGQSRADGQLADLGPRPRVDQPVLVHGDACAPNTLIDSDGSWVGHVEVGDLTVGDRWADLAIASMSLDWNFGPGHHDEFYAYYGIDPDPVRIDYYYRRLWD